VRRLVAEDDEGQYLEFKPAEERPGSLATSLAAFANADGGTLILGVAERTEDGRKVHVIEGVPDVKIATDHLYTAAELCTPKYELAAPERIDVDGATVLVVTVPEGLGQVYGVEGRYVVREGSYRRALSPDEIRSLLSRRGLFAYDREPVPGATRALCWLFSSSVQRCSIYRCTDELRRVGSRRGTVGQPFCVCPSPNAACDFHRTALSSAWLPAMAGGDRTGVAGGISPPSLPVPRRHLCPFPLWPAFPTALVGRCSHEDDAHSVTIEVALRRPSCLLATIDVRARRRGRVRPRERGHSTPPAQWRVRVAAVLRP